MNIRESTASGRPIIPIFANKKKKLRQALYANPSQELPSIKKENPYKKSTDEFSTELEDSLELCTAMDEAMSGIDNSIYKENFHASSNSKNCYSSGFNSKPATFTNKAEWAGQNSRKSSTGRSLDYHTSGYSKTGGGRAPKLMKHPNTPSGNCQGRQFNFAKVSSKPGLPVAVSPAKGSLPPGRATQPVKAATHMRESKMQEENKVSLKYNRQVNLLKSPVDHSMKLITATVTGMKHWNQYRDQITMLFEIFGTLDSALSTNGNGTAKNFLIKDESGALRCTFWEMDRTLPRLIRGQMHRCIGTMDRRTETFNCVSIRPIIPAERRLYWKYIELSDQAMKDHLAALKEH